MITLSRTPVERLESAQDGYRKLTRRRILIVLGLAMLTVAVFCGDVMIGGAPMPVGDLLRAALTPGHAPAVDDQIVWGIRLPMSVTGILVGGALAAAGAGMQTILNNPLAEPYTLGVSAAAGFGAALAAVTGFTSLLPLGSEIGMAGSAWIFAIAACAMILGFSRLRGAGAGAETMILLGIAIVFLFNALLALMQYVASEVQLQQVVFWTLGSLSRATWPQIGTLAVVTAVLLPFFYWQAWTLTAFRMGDDRASALGVPVDRMRTIALIGVSLLAATAVSIAGTIGFIGLVGPHIARILVGEDQRYFLTASILSGATLLTGASMVSKIVVPGVIIPVGVITSLVGVPVFLLIIMTRRQRTWT
ncbi:FecCD family ABC transporter permease [Nocardia macrotermitis]|uniref:Vitamin B12 import system permease protein BtuC n=1 Tax=Nocardia macrotermitis TaxID=2585198 RepID=A0A7K0D2I6_9NOCA|nr:iron ABC transporter permease [Nocardia macrotermitis]MQY19154.1 Vitamin B12 import system permease protein BtuC [Nocardia macrotermitis]